MLFCMLLMIQMYLASVHDTDFAFVITIGDTDFALYSVDDADVVFYSL